MSTLALFLTVGICLAAEQIINVYGGEANINQGMQDENSAELGSVTAIGGICDGSEPTTQLCMVNVYELESQTTLTAADLTSSDDLTVGDDITISGNQITRNSLNSILTYGTFADATTTLAAIANPHSATTTCSVKLLNITNGTTTVAFMLATSTSSTIGTGGLTHGILRYEIATSTPSNYIQSGNNALPDGYTVKELVFDNFIVGPSDYILIHATSTLVAYYGTGLEGITGNSNTFAGSYWIECLK